MISLVSKYQPSRIADFIGLCGPKAILGAVSKEPYSSAWLLTGAPGLGKTTMAQAFFEAIGGQVQHIPARMCDLETVNRVADSCAYVPMMGGWNLVLCDEIDQASKPAQVAWLSILDSTRFPEKTVFVFTSNNLEKLEERFVSRCRHLAFDPPADAEITEFLRKVWSAETRAECPDLSAIVAKCRGNVRNALMDLEMKLLVAVEEKPRTWFQCVAEAKPESKRMKRILVKDSAGKWIHEFVTV